jgi:predicted PurR-regulated permease PerM
VNRGNRWHCDGVHEEEPLTDTGIIMPEDRIEAVGDKSLPIVPLDDTAMGDMAAIRRSLGGILLILSFTAIYFARDVLLPVVLAILIALTISPLVRALERWRVPVPLAASLIMGFVAVIFALSVYLLSGTVMALVDQAPRLGMELRWKLREILAQIAVLQDMMSNLGLAAITGEGEAPSEVVVGQPALLGTAATSVAAVGSSLGVAFVLALFLLASGDFYHRRIVEAAPRLTDKKRALVIVRDVERQISRYLAAITVINAGLGFAVGLAMWVLGMPNPILWGVGAFLLNYLPFLGAVAGVLMTLAVAIITFDTLSQAIFVAGVYLVLSAIEGQFVTPLLVGRRLAINVVAVILTLILWVWLWGLAGGLLAVPFLVVIKVIADHVPSLHDFGRFLGTRDRY